IFAAAEARSSLPTGLKQVTVVRPAPSQGVFPVRAEGDRPDLETVPERCPDGLARCCLPEPGSLVFTARQDRLAVGAEGGRGPLALVEEGGTARLAGVHVPQACGHLATRQDGLAVGAEGGRGHLAPMEEAGAA